jgi:hypothetical protein
MGWIDPNLVGDKMSKVDVPKMPVSHSFSLLGKVEVLSDAMFDTLASSVDEPGCTMIEKSRFVAEK